MDFKFRVAKTDEDRAAIYQLRYELYVEGQHLFQDTADHERRFLCDEDDRHSHLILAEIDGELVGTVRLTGGDNSPLSDELKKTYELARFAGIVDDNRIIVAMRLLVVPEFRGSSLAMACMLKAAEVAAALKAELIVGNCEAHLLNQYIKIGAHPYGGIYNHPQNGVLVPFALVPGDLAHFRKAQSPLLPVFEVAGLASSDDQISRIRAILSDDAAVRSKLETSTYTYMNAISEILDDEKGLSAIIPDLVPEEARTLLKMSHIMNCNPGDGIIMQGHVSRTLYILLSGSLEIRRNNRRLVELDKRGEIVGEVAFFSNGSRMSDVYAGPNGARVLALSDRVLREIMKSQGPAAAKFLYYVAQSVCNKLRLEASLRNESI